MISAIKFPPLRGFREGEVSPSRRLYSSGSGEGGVRSRTPWPMTPSPSYDEGTSPCRGPARGRTLGANCGNCLAKTSARVAPPERQADREPARADEDQVDAEEDAQHVGAGVGPLGDDHGAEQDR